MGFYESSDFCHFLLKSRKSSTFDIGRRFSPHPFPAFPSLPHLWLRCLFYWRWPPTSLPSQFFALCAVHYSKQHCLTMSEDIWRKEVERSSIVSQVIKVSRIISAILDTPLLIWTLKLRSIGPEQYLDGRLLENSWCCWHGLRYGHCHIRISSVVVHLR